MKQTQLEYWFGLHIMGKRPEANHNATEIANYITRKHWRISQNVTD